MGYECNSNMDDKAIVAYCDLLGFSSFIKSNTLQEAVNFLANMKKGIEVYFEKYTSSQQKDDKIGIISISDSVIIYSIKDNEASHWKVIIAAYALLAKTIKHPQYRWRIGISYGDFFCDEKKNIYVGKALVEAHELEKKQDWCGAVLSKTAAEKVLAIPATKTEHLIVLYDVPVKNGHSELYHVINWTRARHDTIKKSYGWLERGYAIPVNKEQEEIEHKLKNTEKFHLEKCVQCRAYWNNLKNSDRS